MPAGDKAGPQVLLPGAIHVVDSFVPPSAPWIYDLVTRHQRYHSMVVCQIRDQEKQYPFNPVVTAPPAKWRRQVSRADRHLRGWRRAHRAPFNVWAAELRQIPESAVTHAHFGPNGWACIDAGRRRVVTTFYGYDMSQRAILDTMATAYTRLFTLGAAFLVEGPVMRERLVALGAPAEKVHLQPLMADLESLPWRAPQLHEGPVIIMAGRLVEKKGFDVGLQAFASIAAKEPQAKLVMLGSGPEQARLNDVIERLDLAARVRAIPFAERATYRSLLLEADVFLQPSRTATDGDTEGGAPVTLLDAQCAGLPVVATRHADIPFVVDPDAAYLCNEADVDALAAALARCLATHDEWTDRSRCGRRHVERQHSPTAVVSGVESVYDEVV